MAEILGLLEKISQKIADIVDNVTSLTVTTVVGNVKLTPDGQIPAVLAYDGAVKVLVSHIDILQGDVTTVVPAEVFTEEPYQALQTFHAARVEEGRNIVQANLGMLHDFLNKIQTSNPGRG